MGFRTRHFWSVPVLLAALGASAEEEAEPCRVRVAEGRAAIFASTNAVREAVAWQPAGSELVVQGELPDEGWVSVEPPESVSVWVYRDLVKGGVVLADKSRVRAGAGMNFRSVGSLRKGDRVEVRGSYGDWLKIKPPPGMKFWMLRDQVEPLAVMPPEGVVTNFDEEPLAGAVTNAPVEVSLSVTNLPPAAVSNAVAAAAAPLAPPELSGYVLENVPGQGARVVLSGILDWGTVGAVAAPFCLVARQPDGDTAPVCHLQAPSLTYGPHVGASVVIEGTRWRVKGSELPVVVPSGLRLVN